MWQLVWICLKSCAMFPAKQKSNSGLLDVQKNACKQPWRVWGMVVHKPNCWQRFYKLIPKYSSVTNFIYTRKILREGKNPTLFHHWFFRKFDVKTCKREEALGCEKYQSQLPFSFHYFWCNTLPGNCFYCFLLSGFKSVVCRFLGFLGSLGCLKVVLRKADLLLVCLSLSKGLLHPRKTFCVCTKLKDGK